MKHVYKMGRLWIYITYCNTCFIISGINVEYIIAKSYIIPQLIIDVISIGKCYCFFLLVHLLKNNRKLHYIFIVYFLKVNIYEDSRVYFFVLDVIIYLIHSVFHSLRLWRNHVENTKKNIDVLYKIIGTVIPVPIFN